MPPSSERDLRAEGRANSWGFAVVFIVVNLHVLRNVASAPYLALYAVVTLWVLNRAIAQISRSNNVRLGLPSAWVLTALIAFLSSIAISGLPAATYGLVRYLFAFPIFLAFVAYTTTDKDLANHLRTMCYFFTFGSLTVPLQYFTGPITFFADASERAGIERFASIFGSLTALGVAAGSYIALTQALRSRAMISAVLAISVGGIASLSKAAIANIALGLGSFVAIGGKQFARVLTTLVVIVCATYFTVQESSILQDSLAASATSFGVEGGTQNYDQSFQGSLSDRLITRPAENFAVLATLGSPLVYLTGGGFGMASTALVPSSASLADMTHNQFAEFVSIGGFVGGGIACTVVAVILFRLLRDWRMGRDSVKGAVLAAFAIWIANSFFANGTAYQPITASIVFAAMFLAAQRPDAESDASLLAHAPSRPQTETVKTP